MSSRHFRRELEKEPPASRTVVDVGANVGQTTSDFVLKGVRTIWFEPGVTNNQMLRINALANSETPAEKFPHVRTITAGATNEDQNLFYTQTHKGNARSLKTACRRPVYQRRNTQ